MLGLVCAFKCEAESIIYHFSLKPYPQKTAYPIYCNRHIYLIVTGLGKVQAAAATAYLHVLTGCQGWLNFGVGGHRLLSVGSGLLAHQVKDLESGRRYYPTFGWPLRHQTAEVLTVDRVERTYSEEGVYDMEASGFCAAAFRFTTAELVHCFKVVSDNLDQPPTRDPHKIRSLVKGHLPAFEEILDNLSTLAAELSDHSEGVAPFLSTWNFTATQQHQLRRYLDRWEACYPGREIWESPVKECRTGKEVLQFFRRCFN